MKLYVSSFYVEPEIVFDFSYKVNGFIKFQIENSIMKPLGLLESEKDKSLSLIVSTKFTQTELEVKLARKSKNRNCGLWFPYEEIVNAQYPLEKYIQNFVKAVPKIFCEWNVTEDQTLELSSKLKKELLNNSAYEFTEEELEERRILDEINKNVKSELGI